MDLGSLIVHLPDGETLTYPLSRSVTIIGRADDNDVIIEHPSISRRHARLVVEPGRLQIDDLDSANGTSVDGEPLEPNQPHRLSGTEIIRLGEVQVRYHTPEVPLDQQEAVSPEAPTVLTIAPAEPTEPHLEEVVTITETEPVATYEDEMAVPAQPVEEAPRLPAWALPVGVVVGLCLLLVLIAAAYYAFVGGRVNGPIIRNFNASPSEIPPGGSTTLTWEVTGAELVGIEPGIGTVPASGSLTVTPNGDTAYTLIAVSSESTVTQVVEVRLSGTLPVIQLFSADPTGVVIGQTQQVTISWSVSGADTINISGLQGPFEPAGNRVIPAPQVPTTYTLVATNSLGETRQDLVIQLVSSGCVVSGADNLNVRLGPGVDYPIVTVLITGSVVDPIGRVEPADWLKVRTPGGQEGWVTASFVACAVNITGFPTVNPTLIPPSPTPTPTPTATQAASPTATTTPVTPTITPTATLGPTSTPRFPAGQVTYRAGPPGDVSLFALGPTGDAITLMEHKSDVAILDWTSSGGGVYLLWVKEGSVESVALIRANGTVIRAAIHPDPQWATVTDGDFSPDGSRLIVEAVAASKPSYYYFDSSGNLLAAPGLPP